MEIKLLYFDEGATLRDIGARYNLSHERIRQLINKAIKEYERTPEFIRVVNRIFFFCKNQDFII